MFSLSSLARLGTCGPLTILALSSFGCKSAPDKNGTAAAAPVPSLLVEQVVPAPADVAAAPADAEKTPSGLATKILQPGSGEAHPRDGDVLTITYVGWRKDGSMFDSSAGRPMNLGMRQLFPGWAEGVKLMVPGEKRRMWVPAKLGYGDTGQFAGDLTVDTELVSIRKRAQPMPSSSASSASTDVPAPEDVATPPKSATKTKSGIAYRVLTAANGIHPTATSTVRVAYVGWTTNGKMFDRSAPSSSFALNAVILGWKEALPLMSVGEKARFWIPARLAYGDTPARPRAPAGALVFDIELLGVN